MMLLLCLCFVAYLSIGFALLPASRAAVFKETFAGKRSLSTYNTLSLSFFSAAISGKTNKLADKVKNLKGQLVSIAAGTSNGVKASADTRGQIDVLVKELERLNQVNTISSSSVMSGDWTLLYTENSGSSAGKLGPFIGDVVQSIDIKSKMYTNYVRIGGTVFEGALSATWDVLGPKLWRVKFRDITFKLFGNQLIKKPLVAEGTWRLTYLDEDLRILYAIGGKNTVKENIYILIKK